MVLVTSQHSLQIVAKSHTFVLLSSAFCFGCPLASQLTSLSEFGGAWDNTAASKPKTPVLKAHTTLKSHHSMCLVLSLVRNKMSSVGYEITWKTWFYRFIPPIYIYLWFTIVLPTLSDFSKGKPGLSSSSAIRLMAWREPEGWPRLRRGFGKSGEINACF